MNPNAEVLERMSPLMAKVRWLQLLKEFNCTVTSTWTNNYDSGEYHTGLGRSNLIIGVRGFHAREKQTVPVRATVEGGLVSVGAFFFLLSFFFLLLSPRIVP